MYAVWQSFKKYQNLLKIPEALKADDPMMDETFWKMNMKVQEPICDNEIEEEEDFVEAEVSCTIKSVGEMIEETNLPSMTYVNFKFTGNKEVFTRF